MNDYTELINALRCIENNISCAECKYYDEVNNCNSDRLMHDAAHALEKQSNMIKRANAFMSGLEKAGAIITNRCKEYFAEQDPKMEEAE